MVGPRGPTSQIVIDRFVPAGQIDLILFDQRFHVEPDLAGVRAYAVLRTVLAQTGLLGVAKTTLPGHAATVPAVLRARTGRLSPSRRCISRTRCATLTSSFRS